MTVYRVTYAATDALPLRYIRCHLCPLHLSLVSM